MNHETFREMLARRAELSPREEVHIRNHLAGCPECRERAAAYARQTALLRALPEVEPPAVLRAGVLDAVRNRPVPAPIPIWRRPLSMVPLAATLLVAGIGLATVHTSSGGNPSASSNATVIRDTPALRVEVNRVKATPQARSTAAEHRPTVRPARHITGPVPRASRQVPAASSAGQLPAATSPAPPMPTPTPAVIHVAAAAPPATNTSGSSYGSAPSKAKKHGARYGPVTGGTAPHAPRHTSPAVPSAPPRRAVPTSLPVPAPVPTVLTPTPTPTASISTPVPYTTPVVARAAAPIRPTVTGTPAATPPPTPGPYAGSPATPTPTP